MSDESFDQLCPHCQSKYRIGPAHFGKRVLCAKCGNEFRAGTRPPIEPPPFSPESFQFAPKTKRCPFCGEQIAASAIKCRFCGSLLVPIQVNTSTHSDRKLIQPSENPSDPILMAVLSGCCIAGLGQIIMGQVTKGVVCILGAMSLAAITMGISIFVTWPLLGIDAYLVAKKLKSGRPVGEWECFPS